MLKNMPISAMIGLSFTALYFLMTIVKAELKSYASRLASGEIKKFKH